MIQRLDNKNESVAREIHALFQASYPIEAAILQIEVSKFPPLKRKVSEFMDSDSEFYGVLKEEKIVALIQISFYGNTTDIDTLIVHPDHFRQGLGIQLMEFVLNTFNANTFTVETGLKNTPATTLYQRLGFQEIAQWDTAFGVRKIKFELVR